MDNGIRIISSQTDFRTPKSSIGIFYSIKIAVQQLTVISIYQHRRSNNVISQECQHVIIQSYMGLVAFHAFPKICIA